MQWRKYRHGGHRCAVRVGDDSLRRPNRILRIDLGNHQRNVGVHPPRGGVVDHDAACGRDFGCDDPRSLLADGEEREVETAEIRGFGVLHEDLVIAATARFDLPNGPTRRTATP